VRSTASRDAEVNPAVAAKSIFSTLAKRASLFLELLPLLPNLEHVESGMDGPARAAFRTAGKDMTLKKKDSVINEAEIAFAELLMKGQASDEDCAEQAGFTRGMGRQVKRRPCVQRYMQERRERLLAEIEREDLAMLKEFAISRDSIVARLWAIANLSPKETKGSVVGQVQALNALGEMLGLAPVGAERCDERAG
jgi:hypothetical protein